MKRTLKILSALIAYPTAELQADAHQLVDRMLAVTGN